MNVVDSSAWLEYFAEGPIASFFSEPIEDIEALVPIVAPMQPWCRGETRTYSKL